MAATPEKKELLIKIPSTHFVDYIEPDKAEPEIPFDRKENACRATVTIHTPVLAGKTKGKRWNKWKVVYNERVIGVNIRDEEFRQKVESTAYRFGVGDKLDVDMVEKKVFDAKMDEYIVDGAGYVITKVWNHIPRKKQTPSKATKQASQQTFFDAEKKTETK